MDTEKQWVLERLGHCSQEVWIEKDVFYVGRQKENDLVCLSLLVSREHCMFTKLPSGLYVTDLGSANHVYVNSEPIRAKRQINLKENDTIGIGCAEAVDDSTFLYKIKRKSAHEKLNTNTMDNERFLRKELSRLRNLVGPAVSAKIPKTDVEVLSDDDDIEIIEPISTASTNKTNNSQEKKEPVNTNSIGHENDLKSSDLSSSNTNVEKIPHSATAEIIDITDLDPSGKVEEILEIDIGGPDEGTDHEMMDIANIKKEPSPVTTKPDLSGFSQCDIVDVDDDDEFPHSQLLDGPSFIKEEIPEDFDDNNKSRSSFFFVDSDDDDENVITIIDSDNEDFGMSNVEINLGSRIKVEPDLELVDINKILNPEIGEAEKDKDSCSESVPTTIDNTCQNIPNGQDVAPHAELAPITTNGVPECLEQPLSSLPENLSAIASTSKCTSSDKAKKKGVEIIQPHFMKPKSRGRKADEKKDVPDSKSSVNTSPTSSTSSSKSSKRKRRKDNKRRSLEESLINVSKGIMKNRFSTRHKKRKSNKNSSLTEDAENNDVTKESTDNEKNDSNSIQNVSSASETGNKAKPKNKTTIVKAKVSTRTRGEMLCQDMLTNAKLKSSTKANPNASKPEIPTVPKPNFSSFVIPRRQIPSSSIPSSISSTRSNLPLPPSSTNEISTTNTNLDLPDLSPYSSDGGSSPEPCREILSTVNENEIQNEPAPPQSVPSSSKAQGLKPNLVIPSLSNSIQKKVSFKENIVAVREFEIEEGNKLVSVKDGLNLRTKKDGPVRKPLELKVEDFLARVFAWEPVWLEQQQKLKTLPPIVKEEDKRPLPNTFSSFGEYYKKMETLLLIETWSQFAKEYESHGSRYKVSKSFNVQIMRNSVNQLQTPNGLRYSQMVLHTLIPKPLLHSNVQQYPVYGDMIILEYPIRHKKIRRAFAYVVSVQQQNPLRFLRSNNILNKHASHSDVLFTYVVFTRIIDEQTLFFNEIARMRSINYLRPHLRLIQGLQNVPHSALRDLILNVNIDEFQLENVNKQEIFNFKPITNEKLNERQVEAVVKFTNSAIKLVPKIALLVGPPGTGKSKVIANLVTEILYGDGRYINGHPPRILVAAPSNAAIDEIVLRLLDIRGSIKDHRFKMVRIGRNDSMHEEVKKISVSELAKREVQKINTRELIEQQKLKLKMDIQALESLPANAPRNTNCTKDLRELRAKYEKLLFRSSEDEQQEMFKLQVQAKKKILLGANIIACTLTSCFTSHMEDIFGGNSKAKIATCIVDEATQSVEAETLIPLLLGVKNLILVGDPNQLPATVMSMDAKNLKLDRSLFTRAREALVPQINHAIEDRRDPIIALNMQYRMVDAISHWPNTFFYNGNLINKVNYKQNFPFQPYRILSLDGYQDDIKFSNTSEAVFVGNLIHCLMTCGKLSSWNNKISIGIITPYQDQKLVISRNIEDITKDVHKNLKEKFVVEVNTIDSFQGQERDVIILSTVRSSGIGFLSDQQRLCVALTRAKYSLIICGNFKSLQRNDAWSDLLRDARSRGVVVRLNSSSRVNDIKPHVIRLA